MISKMLWKKKFFYYKYSIDTAFIRIYYYFIKGYSKEYFSNKLLIDYLKKYFKFYYFLHLNLIVDKKFVKNLEKFVKFLNTLIKILCKILHNKIFKVFPYHKPILLCYDIMFKYYGLFIQLWHKFKDLIMDYENNPYNFFFYEYTKKVTYSNFLKKEITIIKKNKSNIRAELIKAKLKADFGYDDFVINLELNYNKYSMELLYLTEIFLKTQIKKNKKIKGKRLKEKIVKKGDFLTEKVLNLFGGIKLKKTLNTTKESKIKYKSILRRTYLFSAKAENKKKKKYIKLKQNFIIFNINYLCYLDFLCYKEKQLNTFIDKFLFIVFDIKVISYYVKYFYEEVKNYKIYFLVSFVYFIEKNFINFYNFVCMDRDEFLFNDFIFRIYEIFIFNYNLLKINYDYYSTNNLDNFIISKEIFQIKIDLNTFIYLNKYFVNYRDFIYNNYLKRHLNFRWKLLNRKIYIKYKQLFYPKHTLLRFDFVKFIIENNFIIIESLDNWFLNFFEIYDPQVYYFYFKQSFFKNNLNYNKSKFWNFIGFYFKNVIISFVHYIVYKQIMLTASAYDLQIWFFFDHKEFFHKLFHYWEDDWKVIKTLDKIFRRNILSKVLPRNFSISFIKDFLIYLCPNELYLNFNYESNFFFKLMNFIIFDFIYEIVFFFDFESDLIFLEFTNKLIGKEYWELYIFLLLNYFNNFVIEPWFCFFIVDIDIGIIDFFILHILNIKFYNIKNSAFDLIDYSRFVSHNIFFNKNFSQFFENKIFKLNFFFTFYIYSDFILNLVYYSLNLQLLYFFILYKKYKYNYIYFRYIYDIEALIQK